MKQGFLSEEEGGILKGRGALAGDIRWPKTENGLNLLINCDCFHHPAKKIEKSMSHFEA